MGWDLFLLFMTAQHFTRQFFFAILFLDSKISTKVRVKRVNFIDFQGFQATFALWHYRSWSFKSGDTQLERFFPKGNYWILRIGLTEILSSLEKSEFLKLIISFFHYFWCQNWDQWHKMSGKNTNLYFLLSVQK